MKKITITIIALVLSFSVLGCSNDAKENNYNKACGYFIEGRYVEAREIFESLGDYSNCVQMIEKCNEMEIDRQLQGVWTYEDLEFVEHKFENGKITHALNNSDIEFSGEYWIDFDTQLIYLSGFENEGSADFTAVINDMDTDVYIAKIVGYHKQYKYTFDNDQLAIYPLYSEDLLVRK